MAAQTREVSLDKGWQFHSLSSSGHADVAAWMPATVPGVVQLDLLANKRIPDPFYRDNEAKLQWIGHTDWEYRTTFPATSAQIASTHQELVFEGLDTLADVYLNGHKLLTADNMFRTWRVDAKPALRTGQNELRIVFHSAIDTMMPVVKALPYRLPTVVQVQAISEEGIATDPYVRKAPYNYGWDWGPRYLTAGIWKTAHLVTWNNARIDHLHIIQQQVNASDASLMAELDVVADHEQTATFSVSSHRLNEPAGTVAVATRRVHLNAGNNRLLLPMVIEHPALWFPVGYGAQARYEFRATLTGAGINERVTTRTGLRSVELRRVKDSIGESFTFVVNGRPVFVKGADVIPFDSFAPRVTPAQHRQILQSAVDAHMNMVREWGGGYYESDDFYDIADELGLMVWQEFMFGGAQIPGDDEIPGFRENVRQEAIDQVDRLRDHPSIVLWCGNNEVETGWFHWGDRLTFRKHLTADQQAKVWGDYLLVMDGVLKNVVATHSGETPYVPSSPHSSYDQMPDIQTAGDMHYWQVWGQSVPVEQYNQVTPRFMSEFGFQSFPEMTTIRSFAAADDLTLTSPVMLAHQKNDGGNQRIKTYMDAEYPKPKDFASFVYLSQVQQAEAIRVASDHLRSSRPRTMGLMFWQLNDCWPVASWSSIDYSGRWKALQYYAKKFYADVALAPYLHDGVLDTAVENDLDRALNVKLTITLMSFDGKTYSTSEQNYTVPAASAKEISHLTVADLLGQHQAKDTFAWMTLSSGGRTIAERTVYFDHVKDLSLPQATVEHSWHKTDGHLQLTLSSPVLARNAWISFGDQQAQLSDNSFDLIPGHAVTIDVTSGAASDTLEKNFHVMSLRDAF